MSLQPLVPNQLNLFLFPVFDLERNFSHVAFPLC
jgi:hypothetical protein